MINLPNDSAMQGLIEAYLNHDAYSPERLAKWIQGINTPSGISKVNDFKLQLQAALDTLGMVTPALYEKWTGEDMDDQDAVQQRLQEIWDACFGEGL